MKAKNFTTQPAPQSDPAPDAIYDTSTKIENSSKLGKILGLKVFQFRWPARRSNDALVPPAGRRPSEK